MAEATSKSKTIVESVTLELTQEEAEVLVAVLGNISGVGKVRDIISNNKNSIFNALVKQVGREPSLATNASWIIDDRQYSSGRTHN